MAHYYALNLQVVSKVFADSPVTAEGYQFIKYDATNGSGIVNLPTAVGISGYTVNIKKMDVSANTVTADGDGTETIDGALTAVLTLQYETITIISDGANWLIL